LGTGKQMKRGETIKACLSCAPADETAVRRLKRRLTAFRAPGGARIGPAALTVEFPEPQREALLIAAEWLILCCSPATLGSDRVNAEIDAYIRLNPQSRIVVVLLSGEPHDALPTRVRGREPLTADFRPAVDGEELGLLKLAAELLGQDVGALRDAEARRERGGALMRTALAAVLAVAAAGAGGFALHAMEQRARAEAMAGEAVTISVDAVVQADELAQRLAVADEARPDVLSGAEARLDRLLADAPPALAQTRAQMLVRFADLYERRGDSERAAARALAAIDAFEALVPSVRVSYDYVHALLLASYGEAGGGRTAEAIAFAERAAQAARALRDADPEAPRAHAVLAAALAHLGGLQARSGHDAEALALYAETVPALEFVQARAPSDDDAALAALAEALDRLGGAQAAAGDAAAARVSFNRVATLSRARLELDRNNSAAQAQLGDALFKLGQALLAAGQAEAAAEPLAESLAIARGFAAAAPADPALQRQLSERLIVSAQSAASLGRASPELMSEAIAAARANAQRNPEERAALIAILGVEAGRLERARDLDDARDAWREVAALRRAVANAPNAEAAAAYEHVGRLSLALNELPAAGGAYAEAVRQHRAVLEAAPTDLSAKAALASALHQVGLIRMRAENSGGARAAFVEAARLRAEVAEANAADADAALAAADTLLQLAQLQIEPAPAAARRSYERARDIITPAATAHPEERRYAVALRRAEAGLRALPGE